MVERTVFRSIFAQCSPKQRYLIDSKHSGEYFYSLSQKYGFDSEKDIVLCRTISEIILGFYKIEDTVPLLQQELGLDPKTAALLGAEVLEFLAPLSDPNWQPPEEESDEDETNENIPAPEVPVGRIPIKAPAPLHTFASDMAIARNEQPVEVYTPVSAPTPTYQAALEPVYQSTQPNPVSPTLSSIPSYTTPNTPTPTPVPPPPAPDRPRWSTDI